MCTSFMPVLGLEFLGSKTTSYRPGLWVLLVNGFETFRIQLYQRVSSTSLGKEKVESNFININGDLN